MSKKSVPKRWHFYKLLFPEFQGIANKLAFAQLQKILACFSIVVSCGFQHFYIRVTCKNVEGINSFHGRENFTNKPRFEIVNWRRFTYMNFLGNRVEKHTHAKRMQVDKQGLVVKFANQTSMCSCFWSVAVHCGVRTVLKESLNFYLAAEAL